MKRRSVCLLAVIAIACTVITGSGQGVVLTPKDAYELIPTRSTSANNEQPPPTPQVAAANQQQRTVPPASGNLQANVEDEVQKPSPDEAAVAMSIVPEVGGGFDDEYDLPAKMSLRKYLPPVGQQGNVNHCVAWAIAHAAYSCQIGQQRHDKPDEDCDLFSVAFLINQLRQGEDGMDPSQVIDFVRSDGCASQATMPQDANAASKQAITEAANFRALRKERPTKLEDIKTFIYEGYPVVLVIFLDDDFKSPETSEAPYSWSGEKTSGLHAITAVGYDDTKDAVLIMNSWGDRWKDAGFCWVKYANLERVSDDSWCPRAYVVKIKDAAPFNMRTDEQRYQLKKDRRVYKYRGPAVTLSEWKIDDAACTRQSLFALRRDQTLFRYNDDGSWTVLNDGLLKDKLITMMAADRSHPLHVLSGDGELFEYNESSGRWNQVSLPVRQSATMVDLRRNRVDPELRVTTSEGTVFVRDADDATWALAP